MDHGAEQIRDDAMVDTYPAFILCLGRVLAVGHVRDVDVSFGCRVELLFVDV